MLFRGKPEKDSPPRVLIVGGSHLVALERGYEALASNNEANGLAIEFVSVKASVDTHSGGGRRLQVEDICELTSRFSAQRVVSCIGGNAHNVLGLVNHPQRFDFVLPEQPDLPLDESAEILPSASVRAALLKQIWGPQRRLGEFRTRIAQPMIHVESPPPVPSEQHIRKYPSKFASKIERLGIAPLPLRYKMWRLHSSLVREACERLGITFMPVPKETQNPDGTLAEKAWTDDPTHGNGWYGACVVRKLITLLRQIGNDQAGSAHDKSLSPKT